MSEPTRIFYICTSCLEAAPECCGHCAPADLRVMPDGRWLCDGCYDNESHAGDPKWSTLPMPPKYIPETTTPEAD